MTKAFESPTQRFVICIKYFVSIFQYVLMFYYFWFNKLYYTSNYFIITCQFNDFIHEHIFFVIPVDANAWHAAKGLFWNIIVSSLVFIE